MPILTMPNGHVVLRCINHESMPSHQTGQETTMVATQEWNALTQVSPPQAGEIRFSPNAGIPIRALVCSICGYVELYAGPILEPQTWGGK